MTIPAPSSTRRRPVADAVRETTTEELLTKVGDGDDAAFAQLYDRLAGPVMGVAHRVLRNRSHAEDVTQDVLIELWRTAARYHADRGRAMSWALTVAHRRAVDRVRAEQAAADREGRAVFEAAHTTPFDEVVEQVEYRDERDQVRACLERLSELQHQAVTMAYYQGMTYHEVAEVLDAPAGTIKTRVRDALIRLRDCLGVVA